MEEKLVEGRKYLFEILNKVELPGTSEKNFILVGPDGKKYLLPEENYVNYELRTGQKIQCVVDKINCSGKVFLEPDHPYYRVGERYDFLVVRTDERESILGEPEKIAWVRDLHGREWVCPILPDEDILPGYSHLACRIERIRKGELMLSLPAMSSRFKLLKQGQQYTFKVINVRTFENQEFYLLADYQGNLHKLPLEYYHHYGFKKGQSIEAVVVKFAANGECILEPNNPVYQVGEIYPFKYLKIEKGVDFLGNLEAVIFLEDAYQQIIKVKPLAWQISKTEYFPDHILCRVDNIMKGRLFLTVMEHEN